MEIIICKIILPPSLCSLGASVLQKKNEETESKRKKEVNLVISHAPSADNSNLSADGDDSFISVEMDSAMPSPFSEVRTRLEGKKKRTLISVFRKKPKLMSTIRIGWW